MLRTNYRCVQSLNVSVDVTKSVENVHTIIHYTHFWTVTKKDLSSLNNLFMAKFQLISISSYAKNKLQMCSVTQHQCRHRQMCGKCSLINSLHSLLDRYKNDLSLLNIYLWKGVYSIRCPLMLRTNYRWVQSLHVSVDVAKCLENVHKFNQFTHFLSVKKNDLSRLNNLSMARFQLIRMSSYAKNRLQMCSVTQHQCRRHQMCGKCSQIHPVHSLFVRYKKGLVLNEQSSHGKVSTK